MTSDKHKYLAINLLMEGEKQLTVPRESAIGVQQDPSTH